jgi:hypothetical protein
MKHADAAVHVGCERTGKAPLAATGAAADPLPT